jgi:hypothetical protein
MTVVLQTEMTRISLKSAEILRSYAHGYEINHNTIQSVSNEIRVWYARLPPELRLSYLSKDHLSNEARQAVYHIQLLYLGAIMFLYRRVITHVMQVQRREKPFQPVDNGLTYLGSYMEDGLIATRHSARVLTLLQSEEGVYKKYWLAM